jgi:hypothetical protein
MYSTNQRTIFLAGQLDHGGVRGRRRMVYQGAIMEYIRYQYQYIIFNIIIDIRYHKVAINHFFSVVYFAVPPRLEHLLHLSRCCSELPAFSK